MVSGTVPVGVTYEPNVSQILAQGGGKKFHVVYSSHDAPGLIADVLVNDLLPERFHLRPVIRRRWWLFLLMAVGQLGMGLVVVRYDDDAPHLLARLLADACFAALTAWLDVFRRGGQ